MGVLKGNTSVNYILMLMESWEKVSQQNSAVQFSFEFKPNNSFEL